MKLFPRYFLASLALLFALVATYAAWTTHRSQVELRAQMDQKAFALADAVEAGSRNAIRSNALMEEMIADRLLDNARLIDALLAHPLDPDDLPRIAARNRLRRVDLLDLEGRPWTPPLPPRGMMAMMKAPPAGSERLGPDRSMMRYMWGRRWARPPETGGGAPAAPPAVTERRFWQGSLFGVAIGARSFPGIIAVHADADDIVSFQRAIGVERQIAELAGQAGIVAVGLLGPDLSVLAHSDPTRIGARVADAALAGALSERRALSRLMSGNDSAPVFEVARALTLEGGHPALLTIAFSTAPMQAAWRRDLRAGVALGASVLLVGALGLAAIFFVQQRHLRELGAVEREMERRQRLAAVGDVAAAFAHEVRNPLNAVSMGLQRLRTEFTPEPAGEYGRFVDLVQGEVRRLNVIVEQFISLARPLPLQPAAVAGGELLRELAALVEGQALSAGVELRLAVPAELPPLVADRDHLKQVLLNLILNALQAMAGRGGTLTLGAEAGRDDVALTVADTGPGIPADTLPRIFDPYFTTKAGGLGLGLTIARRIVEAHGGALEAENLPRAGARFRVRLSRGRS